MENNDELEREARFRHHRCDLVNNNEKLSRSNNGHKENYTVFVVVDYCGGSHFGAVYEIKIGLDGKVFEGYRMEPEDADKGADSPKRPPLVGDPLGKFFENRTEQPRPYFLECARLGTSRTELCIMPTTGTTFYRKSYKKCSTSATFAPRAFVFNTATKSLSEFTPPTAFKPDGICISAYGWLYFLAHPQCYPIQEPSFECYNPTLDGSWTALEPYPPDRKTIMKILGYAVCFGCILLSAYCVTTKKCEYKVFDVNKKRWYAVLDAPSYPFSGRATVVDETIYALPQYVSGIMAFSLRMTAVNNAAGDDLAYSLGIPSLLQFEDSFYPPMHFWGLRTEYLVHLGNSILCLFQSGIDLDSDGTQHLLITTFCVVNGKILTLDMAIRAVEKPDFWNFLINFCFTPDCEDLEPGEEGFTVTSSTTVQPKHEEGTKGKASKLPSTPHDHLAAEMTHNLKIAD